MSNNIKKAFGTNLKLIRKSKNITQEKLAEIIGINLRQLARIEAGASFVSSETIEKICIGLNLTIRELFDFDIETQITNSTVDEKTYQDNINYIITKCKKNAKSTKKIEFIKLAIEALENPKAFDKIKIMIEGMEILQEQ